MPEPEALQGSAILLAMDPAVLGIVCLLVFCVVWAAVEVLSDRRRYRREAHHLAALRK